MNNFIFQDILYFRNELCFYLFGKVKLGLYDVQMTVLEHMYEYVRCLIPVGKVEACETICRKSSRMKKIVI
jgi:hypothetical protein